MGLHPARLSPVNGDSRGVLQKVHCRRGPTEGTLPIQAEGERKSAGRRGEASNRPKIIKIDRQWRPDTAR